MNKSTPWRDYLIEYPEAETLQNLLIQAENFIEVLGKYCGLTIPPPPILIFQDPDFNAYATVSDEIHVASGVFSSAEKYANISVAGLDLSNPNELIGTKSKLIFFWVLAHEFFHIARSHYAVLSLHGPSARKPIEFDADMMAICGLYRYLNLLIPALGIDSLKSLLFDCIFWPMRAYAGSAFAEPYSASPDYPTWHLRIWTAVTKIMQMDNGDPSAEIFFEKANLDIFRLSILLKECDGAYCHHYSLPQSTFQQFMDDQRHVNDHELLTVEWEKIKDTVQKLQRATRLNA